MGGDFHRVPLLEEKAKVEEVAFVADVMLGRLTRWLRILGYDIIYFHKAPDDFLIYVTLESGRILMTRDRRLAADPILAPDRSFLVEDTRLPHQLREVLERFPKRGRPRCADCNGLLEEVDREQVKDQVPDYVYLTSPRFWRCPSCGKVLWEGTHKRNMLLYLGFNPWRYGEGPSERKGS
jgi:uncharacterized protein with PIN domain